jgi:hypothetical protein
LCRRPSFFAPQMELLRVRNLRLVGALALSTTDSAGFSDRMTKMRIKH